MFKKLSMTLVSVLLVFSFFSLNISRAAEPTISVKLVNYIGNTSSVSVTTTGNYSTNLRLSGENRFEVAVNVSEKLWDSGTVILANQLAFADALAAAPLAYKLEAPILLSRQDRLTSNTKNRLTELNPSKVIVVGGTGSIAPSVTDQLKNMGIVVERIGGADRFVVAHKIAQRLGSSNTSIVVNGLKFADALAVAPYAAMHGYPILLTRSNSIPEPTRKSITNNVVVVGGTSSVSSGVYRSLNADNRIGGEDRYAVAANVIRELNFNTNSALIATGLSFADALTGSVLAAKESSPLILTRPDRLPEATSKIINEKNIQDITILGGTASVSEKVVNELPKAVELVPNVNYTVKSANGHLKLYKGSELIKDFGGTSFVLKPEDYNKENLILINNRKYFGDMAFTLEGSNVRPINKDIPYEDYLKGVVPSEMPASWNIEAVKAQAIAARTYSIDDRGELVADGQTYQVYSGYEEWDKNSSAAVEQTRGQALYYNGNLISAVYSSSNGGYVESSENGWGYAHGYLLAKPDPYDPSQYENSDYNNSWSNTLRKTQISLVGRDLYNIGKWWWKADYTNQEFANYLEDKMENNEFKGKDIRITTVENISVKKFTNSPRTKEAVIDLKYILYPTGNTEKCNPDYYDSNCDIIIREAVVSITGSELRSIANLNSTYITKIDYVNDNILIYGKGWGHGIGMSQWGARNMARYHDKTYEEILNFYYPNTVLKDLY